MVKKPETPEDAIEAIPKAAEKVKTVKLSPESIASRQRAHDVKVAKFLTGGKF